MKTSLPSWLFALFIPALSVTGQSIPNAGFEADTFTAFPGYISGNGPITGWIGAPADRVGLNPSGGSPFANNGTIPEGSNVAIIQASSGDVSSLTTTVTGLTPGTTYVLSFYANSRSPNTPSIEVLVGGIRLNLYGATGAPFPALVSSGSYRAVHGMFTATAASQDLVVANNRRTGDHTLLVDDFKIAEVSNGVITNPGFEAEAFTVFPGYISGNTAITGWTASLDTRVGQNPAGSSPFANNGVIPEGNNVALLQANVDDVSSISTTVTGLTPGAKYSVSCRTNARSRPYASDPWLVFSTDGAGETVTASVTAVGGSNPYKYATFEFVATSESQVMTIANTNQSNDHTLLIDDFAIAPSSGAWGFSPWTGDEDSGLSSDFFYTHAYSLGNSPPVTINGVRFIPWEDGEPGRFTLSGLTSTFGNRTPNNVGGESAKLAKDFRYNGTTGITLENLEPDTDYLFTLYGLAFDAAGPRSATFSSSADGGSEKFTVDLNQFGQGNGMLVTHAYTTDSLGSPVTISFPRTAAGTFHTSGFSNRKATPAAEPGAWTTVPWMDDASSGIDGGYRYTHAFNFNSATTLNVDGVVFTGITGTNPAGTDFKSTLAKTFSGDTNNNIAGYSEPLSRDFVYEGNPEVFNLSGLTPGQDYVFTIYSTGWEAPGGRFAAMYGNPGDGPVWLDQDEFGNNQGIRIEYAYTADDTGTVKIMSSTPAAPATAVHVCAISNREAEPLADTAPVITLDPVGATVVLGDDYLLRAEGTGSGPRSYQWKRDNVEIPGANSPVLQLTDVQFGDAGDYTLTITNEMASSVTSAPATVGVVTAIEGWRLDYGFAADGSGTGEGDLDDFETDGLTNQLEFGFGTNPTAADNGPLNPDGSRNGTPVALASGSSEGVSFKAYFVRRDDHGSPGSVIYTPQFSGDLVTFYDSTVVPTVEADSTVDPDYEVVSVPYPAGLLPDDTKARFYRVKVTTVP